MKAWPCVFAAWTLLAAPPGRARQPAPTAVFDFALDNTSLQPEQAAERQRLKALDRQLPGLLEASGCCSVVPTAGAAAQARAGAPWSCNGCDVDLARKLGAGISVVGWVQKVSSLILNINLIARRVSTGQVIEEGSVDIRGDTDESWSRGLSYLMRNRLHPARWEQGSRS